MLQELLYFEHNTWKSFPDWAQFFLGLGRTLRNRPSRPGYRLVVALALPTRGYAAALTATGLVATEARPMDVKAHFDYLARLPVGSPVRVFVDSKSWVPGLTGGVTRGALESCIIIQTSRDQPPIVRPMSKCISVRHDPYGQRALPHRFNPRQLSESELFISTALPGVDPVSYLSEGARECVLIGQVNQLEAELLGTPVAVPAENGGAVEGRLQHIIRAARWTGGPEAARSEVVTVSQADGLVDDVNYRFAVFDGARAFRRARHCWRGAHRVVLLDKSAPDFMDGVYQLNEDFGRWSSVDLELGMEQPAGIEMMVFEEDL